MARELLEEAGRLASRRSARTLTPGAGASPKQTLMALKVGERLQDHVAPGPTTLLGITGTEVLSDDDGRVELDEGGWAPCPRGAHSLEPATDAVVLITVAPGYPTGRQALLDHDRTEPTCFPSTSTHPHLWASPPPRHDRLRRAITGIVQAATADAITGMAPIIRAWGLTPTALPSVTASETAEDELGSVEVSWTGTEDAIAWPALIARLLITPRPEGGSRVSRLSARSPESELHSEVRADDLISWAQPHRCVAHLGVPVGS